MAEVVLVGGMPAAGKTTVTKRYEAKGYTRLNRDTVGGSVDDLLPALGSALRAGKNVVMDNLYATKASRAGAIKVAGETKSPVNFVLMDTSLEDAQFNACVRMMQRCGRILHPDDYKKPEYKSDPGLFPVAVIYKYRKDFEAPSTAEGFASVQTEKFVRQYPAEWVNKALILDFDGTIRTHDGAEKYPCKPSEVRAYPHRTAKIMEYVRKGYMLFGASNQSGIDKGTITSADAEDCFVETLRQMKLHVNEPTDGIFMKEFQYCPHRSAPISCYCRKPGVGMAVYYVMKYNLDPRQTIYVGDMTTDKTFASRAGFKYYDHNEFFR